MVQVSLFGCPDYLIEDEGTVSTHAFLVMDGIIPGGGLIVSVDAPNLSEFDQAGVSVEGGEIEAVRVGEFDLRMTEYTTLVTLPIALDTDSVSYTIADTRDALQAIARNAIEVRRTIADNPDSVIIPGREGDDSDGDTSGIPFEMEFNDTIEDAIDTGLGINNLSFIMQAEIDSIRTTYNLIDATEDVDMDAFQMQAGDTVEIDIDSVPYKLEGFEDEQQVDTERHLFSDGNDIFVYGNKDGTDTIIDFTASVDLISLVEGELTFEDVTLTKDGNSNLLSVADSGECSTLSRRLPSMKAALRLPLMSPMLRKHWRWFRSTEILVRTRKNPKSNLEGSIQTAF